MSDAEKWRVSEHSLFGKRYIHLERWINSPAHWTIVAVVPVSDIDAASRLALARALVPGWAVVPREATEGMIAALRGTTLCSDGTHVHIYRAMLTAAEEPPHGP